MSQHLYGMVLTHYGTAANNRGENEGNVTTLQKLLWKNQIHTTVSAEAIRFAVRYYFQRNAELNSLKEYETNREYNIEKDVHFWKDKSWKGWAAENNAEKNTYIDDDLMGYMTAEASKEEGQKGTVSKRKGRFEVTRAVSLNPFTGDLTFNAVSGEKGNTSLYATEIHATRYQFGFALTPQTLVVKDRAKLLIDAIESLNQVGGNHSRFLFDFSPEIVVYRWTDDFAPRFLYCYNDNSGEISLSSLIDKVNSGDILARELVIGGNGVNSIEIEKLKQAGAWVASSIKEAGKKIKELLGSSTC